MTFQPATRVRFTDKAVSEIAATRTNPARAIAYLSSLRMTTQNEPKPGRVNVFYGPEGDRSFRTFNARDLVAL